MLYKTERGMALVLTLLVVAIITAMVVEFAYGVYVSTSSLHNWQTSQKLSLAARSAVKLAGYAISSKMIDKTQAVFEMSQKIPYDNPEGTISVRIEDEGAKFNINKMVGTNGNVENIFWYPAMGRLLNALGLKPELADRIVWWINPAARPSLGPAESAKGSPLDSVEELLLIPGIDRESYEKLLPYVTISNEKINVNTAPVPILESLSEKISPAMADRIVARRQLNPYDSLADISNTFTELTSVTMSLQGVAHGVTGAPTAVFRVTATAESGGIRRIIETVLAASGNRGLIKFWKES
ncbi:MAG: type II secretion system minor pseudopilin GspK [Nitrospiraceae bacterium]|nr:type II secretion system minor pseudopilin GspK [Nitrospiraceae bacterium]